MYRLKLKTTSIIMSSAHLERSESQLQSNSLLSLLQTSQVGLITLRKYPGSVLEIQRKCSEGNYSTRYNVIQNPC